MSLGLSIGDIVAIAKLTNKIRLRFVDAPEQFRAISDEVRSLSIVLQDVEIVLPERVLTSRQKTELDGIAQGCRNVLEELEEILGRYQELDSSAKSLGGKPGRVWKRLMWDSKDIDGIRGRITSNIMLFNTFLGQIIGQASLAMKDSIARLSWRQDEQERGAIIDWLTPINYSTQQTDFISRRQKGTGQWLLLSNEFQQWLSNRRQTLFCPGIPGAGKTILTSIVVDYLERRFESDDSVGIAYLYCNFRRQQEQNPSDLLASLLKQLVQGQISLPEDAKSLYNRHKRKQSRPSFDEILKVLQAVVINYSRWFIVIDALDECQVSNGGCRKFLSEIFSLQAKAGANLFVTSRFIPEIVNEFEGSISLEIRASNEDVQRYLDIHMLRLPLFVSRSLDLQEEIKAEIIKAVDGMFLLAQLHLGSLIGKRSPKALRVALKKLPKGSDAYDHAYEEAMERIEGQIADSQELAKLVLSWIACAKRPLTTLELRHALAVEIGRSKLDEENLPDIEDILSVCAGLVTIDEESDIIRLVHYTAQDYFERTQMCWFPNAQNHITITCVTYLLFDSFETGFCPTDKEFEARLQLNPLYDYAACNWGYHACTASKQVENSVMRFLESEAKVSSSAQAMMASKKYSGYSLSVPRQMTGAHLAAYFGLKEAMMALVKNGHDLNFRDTYGWTPLSWAAMNGREAVVKLLLAKDDVDPDSKDKCGQTPLLLAAKNGLRAVVKLLLAKDGVDPDSKDEYGWTPLLLAARNGHEAVVELLLAADSVNPDSKDTKNGCTPLTWAAWNGHEAVVELLLAEDGVDPNSRDTNYRETPLLWAAANGKEAVVRLLLAKDGVDTDCIGDYGRTPLLWAEVNGHEAVVKLLLAKDDVNSDSNCTEFSQMPLSWAAENGDEALVEQLLAKDGVDPDSKDKYSRTPLLLAAKNGHKTVVELLLAKGGVDPDSKDKYNRTPLSWAAGNGHKAVVELLLIKDTVDPDSKDKFGQTPLLWAAANGHKAVVELLLTEDGVNPDSKDTCGETPLSWAAGYGRKAVVELLLAKDGVDPDSKDSKYDRTPLSLAAENGHAAVVELLLTKDGIDLDSEDKFGQTPLSWAAVNGHEAVVELLTRIT